MARSALLLAAAVALAAASLAAAVPVKIAPAAPRRLIALNADERVWMTEDQVEDEAGGREIGRERRERGRQRERGERKKSGAGRERRRARARAQTRERKKNPEIRSVDLQRKRAPRWLFPRLRLLTPALSHPLSHAHSHARSHARSRARSHARAHARSLRTCCSSLIGVKFAAALCRAFSTRSQLVLNCSRSSS